MLNPALLNIYRSAVERLEIVIRQHFGLEKVHLTQPTFFSRLSGGEGIEPITEHDECVQCAGWRRFALSIPAQTSARGAASPLSRRYWHPHVDKDTYDGFQYTALIYVRGRCAP